MTYHIVIATDLTDESLAWLKNAPDADVKIVPPNVTALRDALKTANALIVRDDVQIDADVLDDAPNLKVVGRPTAGLSGIDIEAATAHGVIVMNTPGVSAIAAAEHTIALMLTLSRRLIEAHNSMKAGFWLLDRKRQVGRQLHGKTLGIIGLGRVGQVVSQMALGFGMKVIASDPYVREDQLSDKRVVLLGLRDLLSRSDFITLHVPPTKETLRMIDAERIKQMKEGAFLINTAFGKVWDENAVAEAVKTGHLSGVAVDVYPDEPPYNSPLIGVDRVVHTPHIAENTVEATQDLSMQIVQQVMDALRGTDYRNVVNLPFLPGVDYERIRPYLILAERIGRLFHVLARNPIKWVGVDLRGDDVSGLVKPITVALLKGILHPILGETVSYINAPLLANERGIQVAQVKNLPVGDYANLVSCQVVLEDGEEIVMAGTLLDGKQPHIMQINEYRMNFVPEGHLVVMGSYDQPGVIGKVGTLMADNQINIASWHTGRAGRGGNTLTILTLDNALPEVVLEILRNQEFVRHAHQVEL
ncbi:MAG: phosphoglycerate dehydrogenase [Phototrophicales bacterium]|jgi:D-3-phosphoglycerate dehydrogenase|nr:MAG: phosphoglycerate dehydrogenase [Phototrophicales bacterium]